MKFKLNNEYVNIGIHIIIISIIIACIINIKHITIFITRFFSSFFSLLSPLIIGLVIAYLMDPLVEFIDKKIWSKKEKKNNRRVAATFIAHALIICVFTFIIYAISLNLKSSEGFKLLDNSIKAVEKFTGGFNSLSFQLKDKLNSVDTTNQGEEIVDKFISTMTSLVQKTSNQIIRFLKKSGGYLLNIFIGIIISFYLLMDKDSMLREWNKFIDAIFSVRISRKLKNLWENIDWVISGYIRGQLIDALIMGIVISITLTILKIDYAIIIGIISGFANLIPMVGSTVATILAVLVALAGDTPIKALYALIILIILQQIDGNVIGPKVVGENVNLHPLLVLLSIFIFGSLFGILGMVIAVPVTSLLKHFYSQYINRKLKEKEIKVYKEDMDN